MSFILRFSLSGPASLLPSSLSLGHYGFSGCWFSFIIGAEFFVASPRKHVAGIVGDLAANARDQHGRSRQRWRMTAAGTLPLEQDGPTARTGLSS